MRARSKACCRRRSERHESRARRRLRRRADRPEAGDYAAQYIQAFRDGLKPLDIHQPDGPSSRSRARGELAEVVVPRRLQRPRGADAAHHRLRGPATRAPGPLSRVARRDGRAVRRPRRAQHRKNAFDVGEYGMGMWPTRWNSAATASATSATSTPTWPRPGGPLTIQERDLHARRGFRHPLEAHRRLPDDRSAPLAPAGRLVGLDGRELRVRLLLVSLPGRHDSVRGQADRDPEHRAASHRARQSTHGTLVAPSCTRRITSTSSTCGWTSVGRRG